MLVPNSRSGDVSLLLGNGNGTVQPQRVFDAINHPDWIATGDFNGDGKTDAVVLENYNNGQPSQFVVLLGHGDGTFSPPLQPFNTTTFTDGAGPLVVGDFTGDGKLDVIVFSKNAATAEFFRGNGDGTFQAGVTFATPENIFNAQAVHLNGDRNLDLVLTGTNTGNVYVLLGNGDGTFQPAQVYQAMAPRQGEDVGVVGLAVVNQFPLPANAPTLPSGMSYGNTDIVVTASIRGGAGTAEVILLPGIVDAQGHYTFGAAGARPGGDRRANRRRRFQQRRRHGPGRCRQGGRHGHLRPAAGAGAEHRPRARTQPGAATHLLTQPLAIVTGHADAYFSYTVPTEAAPGTGPQVIDISAQFQYSVGNGLDLEVLDAQGHALSPGSILQETHTAIGARIRVLAPQGTVLTLHVFGVAGGAGVYTLDLDVLPQLASVQAPGSFPGANGTSGGPANTLILTFQGDHLDLAAAQNPANYTVTWLGTPNPTGPNPQPQVIPLAAPGNGLQAVYAAGVNIGVATGRFYPAEAEQTVTLYFAQALQPGTYRVEVSPAVQAAAYNSTEAELLVGGAAFNGHPVVTVAAGVIAPNNQKTMPGLVPMPSPIDLDQLSAGNKFLTQYHDNQGALLTSLQQTRGGDDPSITPALNAQTVTSFLPAVGGLTVLVIWLDPVSADAADSQGQRLIFNQQSNALSNNLARTYIEVANNVEVLVLAGLGGSRSP